MNKVNKAPNPDKLHMGKFFAYQGGGFSMAANFIIIGFVTIYCTDTLKMPPELVGMVLLASKLLDGVGELFAGYIVDRMNFKGGKGRPWDLCFIGLWISAVLMFAIPAEAGNAVKCIWLFIAYTLNMSVFQTMIGAGSTPYTLRAFANKNVLTKVASYGGIVIMLLAIVLKVIFPSLIPKIATTPAGWTKLVAMFAVPLFIMGMMRFIFVKEIYPGPDTREERIKLKDILEVLRGNKYIWCVCGITLLIQLIAGMNAGTYYFKYIIGDISLMGIFGLLAIITLPVMFIFPRFVKRFSVSTLIAGSAVIAFAGSAISFFANTNMALLMVGSVITSLGVLAPPYLSSLMIFDCAKYNAWKGRHSMEATMAAVNNFGSNIGAGVGSAIVGFMLASSSYVGDAAVQPDSAMLMIRLLYTLIPGTFYLLMFVFAKLFKLEKQMPQIEKDLAERSISIQNS